MKKYYFCAIKQSLLNILETSFNPSFLDLINESHLHAVPKNSETHFKAIIVSDDFTGKSHMERHQMLYQALGNNIKNIHALSLVCKDSFEWKKKNDYGHTPKCKGGSKHESKNIN